MALALAATLLEAKEVTSNLRVPAMDCDACSVVIKRALNRNKGVKKVELNTENRTAKIVFDDAQTSEAEIEKAIEKAGFKTEPVR